MKTHDSSFDLTLLKLRDAAISQAQATSSISDIESAMAIAKTLSERTKIEDDNTSQPRMLRFEMYKTWATAIVPLLTIMTLGFTVYIQASQIKETAIANSDADWRETSKNVLDQLRPDPKLGGQSRVDGQLSIQLLLPYLEDERHGTEAMALAMMLASRADDSKVTRNIFASPSIKINQGNLDIFLYRAREIRGTISAIDNKALALSIPYDRREAVQKASWDNLELICGKVSEAVRRVDRPVKLPEDLSNIPFNACDFDKVKFGAIDLTGAWFRDSSLAEADLSDVHKFSDSEWYGSDWWNAKSIDNKLLEYLAANFYPFSDGAINYFKPVPTENEYRSDLLRLCKRNQIACKSDWKPPYGPQLEMRIRPVFAMLTGHTLRMIAERSLGPYTQMVLVPPTPDDFKAIEELTDTKLCSKQSDDELRAAEVANREKPNTYKFGLTCNADAREIYDYVSAAVLPKFSSMMRSPTTSFKNPPSELVKSVLGNINRSGLRYLFSYSGGTDWEGVAPNTDEQDGVSAVVSEGLCSVDDTATMRSYEKTNGLPLNTLKLATSCNDDYAVVREFLLSEVLPKLALDAK